jgi:hypothetical protein
MVPWLEVSAAKEIDSMITSFIKFRPSLLHEFDADKAYSKGEGYPNPRSWWRLDSLIKAGIPNDLEQEVYSGTIGEGAATQFLAHVESIRSKLDLEAVVIQKRDWTFPSAKDIALRWAFAFGVASLATPKTVRRVFEIAIDLHKQHESEYAMVVVQQAMSKDKRFKSCNEFVEIIAKSDLGRMIRSVSL